MALNPEHLASPERLRSLEHIGPSAWAAQRRIPVAGPLGERLPVGGVQRGTVVTIGGDAGAGVTSLALELAAAATTAGEWTAFIDPGSLGGLAAVAAGVDLERCAVVRGVDGDRFAVVVGALLDGFAMVCAAIPGRLALGDARRLQARARERQGVLVVLEAVPGTRVGVWPGEAALRVHLGPGGVCEVVGKGVRQPASRLRLARAG